MLLRIKIVSSLNDSRDIQRTFLLEHLFEFQTFLPWHFIRVILLRRIIQSNLEDLSKQFIQSNVQWGHQVQIINSISQIVELPGLDWGQLLSNSNFQTKSKTGN